MPDQNLLNYIKDERAKSISNAEITAALLKTGWNQDQVKEAFANLDKPATAAPAASPATPSNYFPSFKELLSQAWQVYRERWTAIVGTLLTTVAIVIVALIPFIIFTALLALNSSKSNSSVAGVIVIFELIYLLIMAVVLLVFILWSQVAQLVIIRDRAEKIGFKAAYGRSKAYTRHHLWHLVLPIELCFSSRKYRRN